VARRLRQRHFRTKDFLMSIWLAQLILAVLFLIHGLMLLVLPTPLRSRMASLPGGPPFFRFIGVAEVLAAAGLTLPTWTGVVQWLTPLAAAGLLVIMVGAAVLHLRRAAYTEAIIDFTVLAFIAVVGYLTL
jgi:DoxX-like family